jgi:thioredoxin 1
MLLNQTDFENAVLGSSEPVLVDFYAEWCGPCKAVAPVVDRLAGLGQAVCKVDIDEHPELATRYGVNSIPTLLVFKDGEVVSRFVGVQSERKLREALDSARA